MSTNCCPHFSSKFGQDKIRPIIWSTFIDQWCWWYKFFLFDSFQHDEKMAMRALQGEAKQTWKRGERFNHGCDLFPKWDNMTAVGKNGINIATDAKTDFIARRPSDNFNCDAGTRITYFVFPAGRMRFTGKKQNKQITSQADVAWKKQFNPMSYAYRRILHTPMYNFWQIWWLFQSHRTFSILYLHPL